MTLIINAIAGIILLYYVIRIYSTQHLLTVKNPCNEDQKITVTRNLHFLLFSIATAMVFLGPFSLVKYIFWILILGILCFTRVFVLRIDGIVGCYLMFVLWAIFAMTYSNEQSQGLMLIIKYILPLLYLWLGYNAINTKEETTEAFANELDEKFPPKVYVEDQGEYETLISIQQTTVKGAIVNENRGMMTIISFSLMYLAFIFVAVVGTILSIQSLSDSTKYKYRYETLHKLGLNEKELNQTLQKQLIVFFIFPIIYPIFISILSSFSLNVLFQPFMTNDYSMLLYVVGNILLFLVIYLIYFLATYFSFKKNRKEV